MEHAWQMVEAGADVIDVGAESTRPGYQPITAAEEIKRLNPVVEKLLELPVPLLWILIKQRWLQKCWL